MNRQVALWVGFGVVALHNLEEELFLAAFLAAHRHQLPSVLAGMTPRRFDVSLAIVTVLLFVLTWAAARSRTNGPWLVAAVAVYAGAGVNGLQHLAIAAWLGVYAPGVITGLALVLPYAFYLVLTAVRQGWVRAKPLAVATVAVVLLTAPFLIALHLFSAVF